MKSLIYVEIHQGRVNGGLHIDCRKNDYELQTMRFQEVLCTGQKILVMNKQVLSYSDQKIFYNLQSQAVNFREWLLKILK